MEGLGKRLRARAQALGLTDTEVARRAGLGERRYGHYIQDRHEPDLGTLVKIASVFGATIDSLLLPEQGEASSERQALMARLTAAAEAMEVDDLRPVVRMLEVLVEDRRSRGRPAEQEG